MTQVKIKYVNTANEGKKFGSIKDFDGNSYMVPAAMVGQFMAGTVVDVNLKTETWGTSTMQVVAGINGQATNGSTPITQGGNVRPLNVGSQLAAPRDPTLDHGVQVANPYLQAQGDKDRTIFITGVTGRAMGSGKFVASEIRVLAAEAAAAYDALPK